MARMLKKWTGRLFAAFATAAFAALALEYVGVNIWSEPPTAVPESGIVSRCEFTDGGLLLEVTGGADDVEVLVDGVGDTPLGYQILSFGGEVLSDGYGDCIPLSEWPEAAAVFLFATDGMPIDAGTGVLCIPFDTPLEGDAATVTAGTAAHRGTVPDTADSPTAGALARLEAALRTPDGGYPGLDGTFNVQVGIAEPTEGFTLFGLAAPGGSFTSNSIPEFAFDAPRCSNVCSVVATGGWFTPAVTGEYAFQVEADDDVCLSVGGLAAVSQWPDNTPGKVVKGWFVAGTRYDVSFSASSIGGPAIASVLKFAEFVQSTNFVGIVVTPHEVKFSRKTGVAESAVAQMVGTPTPDRSYEIRCVRCDPGLVATSASASVDFGSPVWDGTNRTATATFALFEDGTQIDSDSAVFTPLPEKDKNCDCDCNEGTYADTGCVEFSQRFGRTPWIAGLPVGRLAIRETEPAERLWTPSALVYDHPMCRRVAVRRNSNPLDAVILDPFGEGTEYKDGRPAGMSAGLARGIRYDADGLLVETLEDRMEIRYDADGSVKSLKPADGLPVAVGDLGIQIHRSASSGAVTSVVSRADGRMDVDSLSPTSYRVTWRGPSGAVAKTFTFSGNGSSVFRLLEYRNEGVQFESVWNYYVSAQDWTFTKAPNTAAAKTWAKSIFYDTTNRVWYATRSTIDATGGVTRAESSALDVCDRSIMETSRTVGGRPIYFAERNAEGTVALDVNATGLVTSHLYDGWNRATNDAATVKGGILRTTSWTYSDDDADGGVIDRRPRRRVVTENGIVVEDEETLYESNRVTRVIRAGTGERASFRELDERGRVTLSVDETGRAVRTEYSPFDAGDFSWTETRDEGVWAETDGFFAVDGKSTRRVTSYDASGNAVATRDYAFVGGEWRETAWTTNRYNAAHKLVSSVRSDGKSAAADWICTGPLWRVGEDGVATTNTFDAAKAMSTSTRYGPHGAVTTAYERDAEGRVVRETDTAEGCGTLTRSRAYDEEDRVVRETDEQGRTTLYAYSSDGRTTTVTFPSGGTRVTTVNPDGSLASVTGTAVTPEYHAYGVTADGLRWEKVSYLAPDGARWTKTYRNAFDEVVREERPGANGSTLTTEYAYNAKGQLVSKTATSQPTETRAYNAWGDIASVTLAADGETRTAASETAFEMRNGEVWRVASREVSCSDAAIAPLTTTNAQQVSGLSLANESRSVATDVRGNATETWTTFDPATSTRLSYERVPGASNIALSEAIDGAQVRTVSHSAVTNAVAYDAYRRATVMTDGRGNATTNAYDAAGRLASVTDPTGAVTRYAYDAAGRLAAVTNALGIATTYDYDVRGNKTCEGGGTYPVAYAYDSFNVMTNMTTYRAEGSQNGDTTTWLYDEATGLLLVKTHADGNGPAYTYTDSGNLATRTWARGVVTTYSYNGWNSLTNTVYSDGTPAVSLMYDALGRQTNAVDAVGTTKLTYDAYGSLVREKVSGLYSKTLQRHYDDFGRGTGYTVDSTRMTKVGYEEDTGRIHGVKSGGVWLTNRYLAGSDLRDRIKYGSSGYTYYTYEDSRDLLAQVRSEFGGVTISQYDYENDALGRRTEIARSGTAMSKTRTDAYGYNDRNELIYSRRGAESAEITEYAYAYDDIGNRLSSLDLGTNRTYTANNLNQYTQISNLCDTASLREEFVPQYDLDGNQTLVKTSTGIWSVTYNGENRPVSWTCGTTNIVMSFDRMGRRVSYLETVSGGSQSLATVTNGNYNFVYDGYLCVQRIHGATKNVKLIFTWDPLAKVATRPLMIEKPGSYKMHVTHDGNKNVSELVFFSGGGIAAHYEYAPFGALTASTRNTSVADYDFRTYNPFRFSSEYADDAVGLVYYNYRHYEPIKGRWLNRDFGGLNLYEVELNNFISLFDFLGKMVVNPEYHTYDKLLLNNPDLIRPASKFPVQHSLHKQC
ncbi:MAG: RHS repeat protein [Kiritimatiellae bacterium]|nr:RHS repeat protein [Kiritimatiellia bacterium]